MPTNEPNQTAGWTVEEKLREVSRLNALARQNGWPFPEDNEEEVRIVRERWVRLKERFEAIEAGRPRSPEYKSDPV